MRKIDFSPKNYEEWLFKGLGLKPGEELTSRILEPIFKLNHAWIDGDETMISVYKFDNRLMVAYSLYYMTMQMPKLWFMIDRNPQMLDDLFNQKESLHIADMGCGPGTYIWALLFYLYAKYPRQLGKISVIKGVDHSNVCITLVRQLFHALVEFFPQFQHIEFQFIEDNWQNQIKEKYDWINFGNTINESDDNSLLWVKEVDAEIVSVIEPGNTKTFQKLLPLRSIFMEMNWHIHFPCPTSHECPMSSNNWCHFHINRFANPLIQRISNKASRLNSRHHFVGYMFSRFSHQHNSDHWRVLSTLKRVKRSGIRFLCNGQSMIEAVVNRKDKTECNKPFFQAQAGDVIHINAKNSDCLIHKQRITKNDAITVLTDTS